MYLPLHFICISGELTILTLVPSLIWRTEIDLGVKAPHEILLNYLEQFPKQT